MTQDLLGAGRSAEVEATRCRLRIEAYRVLLAEQQARMGRFRVAGRTERRVAEVLAATSAWGWELLADRRRPRSRSANVDLILVGPGGVLVIDVKAWREPGVVQGMLFNGDAAEDGAVDELLAVTAQVEEVAAAVGLAPLLVSPLLVFAGAGAAPRTRLGRVELMGEADVVRFVAGRPERLDVVQVEALVALLGEHFPPYDQILPTEVSVVVPEPVLPRTAHLSAGDDGELALFDAGELEQALLVAAMAGPVESWMTWLHPAQAKLVRQSRNGPARVRGPAGTGKTVVGLHRAAYLAETRPGRILVTSFVRTLPGVLGSLYARLSPRTVERVEFVGLYRWAFDLLRERGIDPRCDQDLARRLFNNAWVTVGRHGALGRREVHPDYWWEEISCVVKGRGLTDYADYAALRRVGRRTPLAAEHREAVWDLYLAYDAGLRAAGIRDLADVLRIARDEVHRRPPEPGYAAVVVDEVQDLNLLGVQLLHALVGDRPDGLLLIGDGQQAVYPGGFSLAEAGINVAGARSTVLTTNYRNAGEILDAAVALVAGDDFDDLDGTALAGARDVQVARRGGVVVRVDQPDGPRHDSALVTAIRQHRDLGVRPGDMAVLTDSAWAAARHQRLLAAAGIEAITLEDYDGTSTGAVKVGTFRRAKGLEFAHVYLPRLTDGPVDRLVGEDDSTYRERVELARRRLFVAMTRARDLLWLGYVG